MENNEYIEMQPRLNSPIPDTPRIIEKYTNEEGEVDVNRMASKMSQVTQQNYNFKRIFLFSSLFLVVAIGLMISANIIGAIFLRDSKVKDARLVTTKDVPVSVQTSLYDVPIYLFTDTEVLDGLKYLNVPVEMDGINSTLHIKVSSYVSIPGKQLIFIGDKYCVILNKHNYQLVLNDKTFDPLSLNNTMDPSNEETSEVDSNTANLRTVYNSHPEVDGHKKIALTKEVSAKRHMKESDAHQEFVNLSGKGSTPVAATPRASIVNLKYYGGSVVTNGIIVPIIWNDPTNGNFNAANLQTCYRNMGTFLKDLLKSKINTHLAPGKKGSDPQAKVSSVDQIHYLTPDSSRRKKTLSDSDISNQLKSWLNIAYVANKPNSTIPKNTSNKLQYMYMIFFPSGIKLSSGFCSSYCGFHTYTNGYNYGVMPWVGDCMGSCGMSSYVSTFGGATCGSLYSVTAHEVNEMANDPYFNGYYDKDGWESADKCSWSSPGCFKNPQTGNSYCFQQMWNHSASSSSANDAGCTKNFQY